jgi:hypothetical protein
VGSRGEQLTESSLATGATSDHHSSAKATADYPYKIIARDVRGLQIGERNYQLNTYEYEVERPDIDFAAVLSRAEVREALKALSRDPSNADLQRTADRLLAQGPLFRREPQLDVQQNGMSSEQESSIFDAFIFVRRCAGVQIGDDATQKNRFLYVVAPTLDARQLLADDPSARAAIINCVCSTDKAGSEDVLKAALTVALEAAVLISQDIRTAGDQIRVPAYDVVHVVDKDGVQLDTGNQGKQENKASATVVIPGSLVKSVQEERIIVHRLREQDNEVRPRNEEPDLLQRLTETVLAAITDKYKPHGQDNSNSSITDCSDRFEIGEGLQNGDCSAHWDDGRDDYSHESTIGNETDHSPEDNEPGESDLDPPFKIEEHQNFNDNWAGGPRNAPPAQTPDDGTVTYSDHNHDTDDLDYGR